MVRPAAAESLVSSALSSARQAVRRRPLGDDDAAPELSPDIGKPAGQPVRRNSTFAVRVFQ
eukprot:351937-Chlamydomonas_euryale.AAC.6